MRVITGEFGGRKLKAVPGQATRPTSDKVKEAAFQMMGPYFEGGSCLDLFAGSGSLGIEAVSRGFDTTVFIEKQAKAIHIINDNIRTLGIEEQSEVIRMDAFAALRLLAKQKKTFDLILLDPPYKGVSYDALLAEVLTQQVLSEHGVIYCEHPPNLKIDYASQSLQLFKQVNYGTTTGITLFKKI